MEDNKALIDSLARKVAGLIDDNRRLRGELGRLTGENDRTVRQRREAEEKIRLLEKRIKTLETAGSFVGNRDDNRAARLRVNKLLREIDRCIALMNR